MKKYLPDWWHVLLMVIGVVMLSWSFAQSSEEWPIMSVDVIMGKHLGPAYTISTVAELPDKTNEPRLVRVVDKEAGVICYLIQNDSMDFYSGLQCMVVNPYRLQGMLHNGTETDK